MLGQRRRRWPNIETLGGCVVFAGLVQVGVVIYPSQALFTSQLGSNHSASGYPGTPRGGEPTGTAS